MENSQVETMPVWVGEGPVLAEVVVAVVVAVAVAVPGTPTHT